VQTVRDSSRERLYLRGPKEVDQQMAWVLTREHRNPKHLPLREQDGSDWTHRIEFDGPLSAEARSTLSVLQSALTLSRREELRIALALDFHMVPTDGVDPQLWPHTEAGSLLNRAKYRGSAEALTELGTRLSGIATRHALYTLADVVLSVPGHDSSQVSFGERLAHAVASNLSLPLVSATCSVNRRPQAKSGEATADLESLFSVDPSVQGQVCLIVDDVYRSGSSMVAVARAAQRSSARACIGIAATRTLRAS